jgi:hypothetical protein
VAGRQAAGWGLCMDAADVGAHKRRSFAVGALTCLAIVPLSSSSHGLRHPPAPPCAGSCASSTSTWATPSPTRRTPSASLATTPPSAQTSKPLQTTHRSPTVGSQRRRPCLCAYLYSPTPDRHTAFPGILLLPQNPKPNGGSPLDPPATIHACL